MTEHGAYKTTDLTLAAILIGKSFSYKLEKKSGERHASWVFTVSDEQAEDFDEIVERYHDYNFAVEPRDFMMTLGVVRRELYALIPPPGRLGAPARSS